eukprot:TRINITY_DN12456_c0_g1_i1.p1 TRINITY_DN12456_c0_g1~~TRINITY_DN12456_c0_g1_i1.p1  ORF type:complete len:154 (-),score=36.44 TRINITY_DN12456_c0_g1_i1:57-518(-)
MQKEDTSIPPEKKKWKIVYPLYINSKRTLANGRRIPKGKCVDNPRAQDVYAACQLLGYECVLEQKSHPQEWGVEPGRVRVHFKQDGKILGSQPDVKNSRQLYIKIAETVPKVQKGNPNQGKSTPTSTSTSSPSSTNSKSSGGGGGRNRRGKNK